MSPILEKGTLQARSPCLESLVFLPFRPDFVKSSSAYAARVLACALFLSGPSAPLKPASGMPLIPKHSRLLLNTAGYFLLSPLTGHHCVLLDKLALGRVGGSVS